jgi:hypothetical protein
MSIKKALSLEGAKHNDNASQASQNAATNQRIRELQKDGTPFRKTVTLTSAAAGTPVNIIPDIEVDSDEKVYVDGFNGRVDGATPWATTANVKIQDIDGVDFVTSLVADLTANARVYKDSANTTFEDAASKGTGGTAGKGLQIKGDANGTGSDYIITVWGVIK